MDRGWCLRPRSRHRARIFGRRPVGTGPFRFREWRPQNQIVLERNTSYNWASSAFKRKGPAALGDVTFRFIPEDATRAAALERGEVDLIQEVAVDAVERFRGNSAYTSVSGVSPGGPVIYWLNTEVEPLNDVRVRKAILHGFNRAGLVKGVYRSYVVPTEGPLSPSTWAYTKKVEGLYRYDPSKAKRLLDEAGWAPGPDGTRLKAGKALALRLRRSLRSTPRRVLPGQYAPNRSERRLPPGQQRRTIRHDAQGRRLRDGVHVVRVVRSAHPQLALQFGQRGHRLRDLALARSCPRRQARRGICDGGRRQRAAIYEEIQLYIMDKALLVPLYAETEIDAIKVKFKGYRLDRGSIPALRDHDSGVGGRHGTVRAAALARGRAGLCRYRYDRVPGSADSARRSGLDDARLLRDGRSGGAPASRTGSE